MFINNSSREHGDKRGESKMLKEFRGGRKEQQSPKWRVGVSHKALSGHVSRNPQNSLKKENDVSSEPDRLVRETTKEVRTKHKHIPGYTCLTNPYPRYPK